jgi:hypothetical protein
MPAMVRRNPFSAFPTAKSVSAGGACVGEVQVRHHDRRAVLLAGVVEHSGDRGAYPPVTARRW